MLRTAIKFLFTVGFVAALAAIGWEIRERLRVEDGGSTEAAARLPAPVEVAPVTRGELVLRRTISGTIEASSEFLVAPKVAGRVVRLDVDLADPVRRPQVVAQLDDAEFVQAVAQAEADHAVAIAQLAEARGALEIAERALKRVESLREKQIAAETEVDTARADHVAREAQLAVAKARVTRAEAAVEAERIRLGYTRVLADWAGADETRVVAERFVDEGETVSANAPLFRVVDLDPVIGVVFVPERDYARLRRDQPVTLRTDAYPGRAFSGAIARISPVFREATRQARVELRIDNPDQALKPGMFVRATVELDRVRDAWVVPFAALTERDGATGVFQVVESTAAPGATEAEGLGGPRVRWRPVEVGVVEGDRAQVLAADGESIAGRVVTLGQHLIDDGVVVAIPGDEIGGETRDETGAVGGVTDPAPPEGAGSRSAPESSSSAGGSSAGGSSAGGSSAGNSTPAGSPAASLGAASAPSRAAGSE